MNFEIDFNKRLMYFNNDVKKKENKLLNVLNLFSNFV